MEEICICVFDENSRGGRERERKGREEDDKARSINSLRRILSRRRPTDKYPLSLYEKANLTFTYSYRLVYKATHSFNSTFN